MPVPPTLIRPLPPKVSVRPALLTPADKFNVAPEAAATVGARSSNGNGPGVSGRRVGCD